MFATKESKSQTNLHRNKPILTRKCTSNCPLEKEKSLVQRRANPSASAASEAPPIVHEILRSSGQPLDKSTRAFMEPRFNQDFSHVRVHTDVKAAESARAVNALAYTVGHNIVMRREEYAPATNMGKRLLAHELTHVVQQGGSQRLQKLQIGAVGDVYEREADRVAERIVGDSWKETYSAIANQAPSNCYSMGGLKPGVGTTGDQVVGGRTVGEVIGDVGRVVGTTMGNVIGSTVGLITNVSISSNTNSGPTWSNHGRFNWQVGFNTTGRNGWLVQEIVNTYRAQNTAGNDVVPSYTPHYWEAWHVDGVGNITPNIGPNHDYWIRPSRGNNTQGHWSMRGRVYFTQTNPATQGFIPGSVPDAGILLSTTTAPAGLGIARLHRYAQGTWDSTGSVPTHTGSAGP